MSPKSDHSWQLKRLRLSKQEAVFMGVTGAIVLLLIICALGAYRVSLEEQAEAKRVKAERVEYNRQVAEWQQRVQAKQQEEQQGQQQANERRARAARIEEQKRKAERRASEVLADGYLTEAELEYAKGYPPDHVQRFTHRGTKSTSYLYYGNEQWVFEDKRFGRGWWNGGRKCPPYMGKWYPGIWWHICVGLNEW